MSNLEDGKVFNSVTEVLSALEDEFGFQVVYCCEFGSREFGYNVETSDLDLRCVVKYNLRHYLGVHNGNNDKVIKRTVDVLYRNTLKLNCEIECYDVQRYMKAIGLSDMNCICMLASSTVYKSAPAFKTLRCVFNDYFTNYNKLASSFLGMSITALKGSCKDSTAPETRLKNMLYVIRGYAMALSLLEQECVSSLNVLEILVSNNCQRLVTVYNNLLTLRLQNTGVDLASAISLKAELDVLIDKLTKRLNKDCISDTNVKNVEYINNILITLLV